MLTPTLQASRRTKKTPVGEVPVEWAVHKLGELCRIIHGYAFASHEMVVSDDRSLPIVVTIGNFRYDGGFRFGTTATKRLHGDVPPGTRLHPGSLLLIMTCQTPDGAVLGIPGVIPSDGQVYLHNQRMGLVEILDETRLDSAFLFHVCCWSGLRRHLVETAGGTKVLHTSPGKIESFRFAAPPLGEQRKIATVLMEWDHALEHMESLLAAKQELKRGLMQQLLTGRKRFKELVTSMEQVRTHFGPFPADWPIVYIGDVADEMSEKNDGGQELPVLSCTKHRGLVNSLEYFGKRIFSDDTSSYKVVRRGHYAYATNHIEEGSIGYQNLHDTALISPMYTVFRTRAGVDHSFFFKLLKTELYRHIFETNTNGSISRRGALRWDDFSRIKVHLPGKAEQRRIAAVLEACDREIELLEKQLAALKEQKRGLMQKLLTGEVRVRAGVES
jgi:type I restriction enzyme S subunit